MGLKGCVNDEEEVQGKRPKEKRVGRASSADPLVHL
jgi:hypothetical protein